MSKESFREFGGDSWEQFRQDLEACGGYFDAQGNITLQGKILLRTCLLTTAEIGFIEEMQKNHVGAVTVICEALEEGSAGPMSARNRGALFADALRRAEEELKKRGKEQEMVRG